MFWGVSVKKSFPEDLVPNIEVFGKLEPYGHKPDDFYSFSRFLPDNEIYRLFPAANTRGFRVDTRVKGREEKYRSGYLAGQIVTSRKVDIAKVMFHVETPKQYYITQEDDIRLSIARAVFMQVDGIQPVSLEEMKAQATPVE